MYISNFTTLSDTYFCVQSRNYRQMTDFYVNQGIIDKWQMRYNFYLRIACVKAVLD